MALQLYHFPSAVCAAKVRIVLAEKEIAWESRLIDLQRGDQWSPEYLALNPKGVVPTLIHDDAVISESTVICEYLDDAFPDIPMRPSDAVGRAQMRAFTKREDGIHDAINVLTSILVFCPLDRARPADEQAARLAQMPFARRSRWIELMRDGAGSRLAGDVVVRIRDLIRDMAARLEQTRWLAGADYTLADSGLVAFLNRLDDLGLSAAAWGDSPAVAGWLDRSRARAGYHSGLGDWLAQSPAIISRDENAQSAIRALLAAR